MINKFLAATAILATLGFAAAPAGAQTAGPRQNPAMSGAPTAGGERGPVAPVRPGADPIITPNADAQVGTTRNTRGSTPTDDRNSASALGGPGTGAAPGTSTNR